MALKDNINRIHIDLLNNFNSVEIKEGSDIKNGNFIKLLISDNNRVLDLSIRKRDLELNRFNWTYKSNPLVENSHLVERISDISSFTNDIKDIFENKRFDSEYIKTIN